MIAKNNLSIGGFIMIDLTRDNKCYTHYLINKLDKLAALSKDNTCTADDFRNEVLQIIEPATYDVVAKPRFIANMKQKTSKLSMYYYVLSSVASGLTHQPVKKQ